jgi:hypothetical protein
MKRTENRGSRQLMSRNQLLRAFTVPDEEAVHTLAQAHSIGLTYEHRLWLRTVHIIEKDEEDWQKIKQAIDEQRTGIVEVTSLDNAWN